MNGIIKGSLISGNYELLVGVMRANEAVLSILTLLREEAGFERSSHAQDLKKVLEKALTRLNETQRSLVLLKDYEGYSYEEIGQITGLNESQVKVYLHRARIQLKNYLVSLENLI